MSPALAAGCTIVIKPCEITPLTAIRTAEPAEEAGFPAGVVTVECFATEEEAVARANSTVYGLSAGFWTRDPDRMARVSRAFRFGTMWKRF